MTRPVWADAAEAEVGAFDGPPSPDYDSGVPVCREHCARHDGKRCEILGERAPLLCEPVVQAMAQMLTDATRGGR